MIFHPSDPKTFYLLPRDEEEIRRLGSDLEEALARVFEWCRESHLRWYLDSEVGSQTLELARIKKRPNLSKTKEALLKLAPSALVEETESRGDWYVVIFLEGIGGDVTLDGTKSCFSASVTHTCDANSHELRAVLDKLEKQGFVLPYVSEGVPHPEIVKLIDYYFPVKNLVPGPIPAIDRTPAEVVLAFIAAANCWEAGLAAWSDAGLPYQMGFRINESIVAEFCVLNDRKSFSTYSKPPDFDPKTEMILSCDQKSSSKATVVTKREGSFPVEREYRLRRIDNIWRIDEIWRASITFGRKEKAERWF